jgi:hypothetical protein
MVIVLVVVVVVVRERVRRVCRVSDIGLGALGAGFTAKQPWWCTSGCRVCRASGVCFTANVYLNPEP